jgi:hypothetical protein
MVNYIDPIKLLSRGTFLFFAAGQLWFVLDGFILRRTDISQSLKLELPILCVTRALPVNVITRSHLSPDRKFS